jgi:hypothetical protein
MHTHTLSAIAGAFLLTVGAGSSLAADSGLPAFSANVAYVTDYRFLGISQGDRAQVL